MKNDNLLRRFVGDARSYDGRGEADLFYFVEK